MLEFVYTNSAKQIEKKNEKKKFGGESYFSFFFNVTVWNCVISCRTFHFLCPRMLPIFNWITYDRTNICNLSIQWILWICVISSAPWTQCHQTRITEMNEIPRSTVIVVTYIDWAYEHIPQCNALTDSFLFLPTMMALNRRLMLGTVEHSSRSKYTLRTVRFTIFCVDVIERSIKLKLKFENE